MHHDGLRRGRDAFILRRDEDLRGFRHVEIHLIEGWWINRTLGSAEAVLREVNAHSAYHGGVIVERYESEIGILRPKLCGWTSYNPYRDRREHEAYIRRGRRRRLEDHEVAMGIAMMQWSIETGQPITKLTQLTREEPWRQKRAL